MTNFEKIKQMTKGEYAIHLVESIFDEYEVGLSDIEKVKEMSAEEYVKWLVRYVDTTYVCKYCPQYDNCNHYCEDKDDSEILYEWLNREAVQ